MSRGWVVMCVFVLAGCGSSDPAPAARATAAAATATATATAAEPVEGRLPGATATAACPAAGDFWPTMTLALDGDTAWLACKEESRVTSLAGAEVQLNGPAIAVLSAYDAVWALDGHGTLYRIEDGRVATEIDLQAQAPYNLWAGDGAVWSIDDGSGEVIRIDPQTNRVTEKVAVGDGPADMVFDGATAWVVNHRDRALVRLDTRSLRFRKLATLRDGEAPERIAQLAGSLWITGRGTDLLRVDPRSGRVRDTIEIGGSGIDVIAAGGALWVPSRSEETDPTGFPTMESLQRVTPDGRAREIARADGRLDVHGLAADDTEVWLADNAEGILYRVPLT